MDVLTRSLFVLRVGRSCDRPFLPTIPTMRSPNPCIAAAARYQQRSSRFDSERRIRTTDGWETEASADPTEDDELPPLRTTLTRDATRTIIARNTSPDIGFDRSINPYRGCEHGCIYCFARPTHAYLGLSPGLDFETKILFKPDAAKLLDCRARVAEIPARRDRHGHQHRSLPAGRARAEDHPPDPAGAERRSTIRSASSPRASSSRATSTSWATWPGATWPRSFVSITTLDKDLARAMEPRASAPHRRLEAIRALVGGRHPDRRHDGAHDPRAERPRDGGDPGGGDARPAPRARASPLLRLPLEIKELFEEWLRQNRPDRAERVLSLVRQTRGGALYQAELRRAHARRRPDRPASGRALRRGGEAPRAQPHPLPPRDEWPSAFRSPRAPR